MEFVWGAGQTPIDPNESAGLIPDIATMAELNALETANIANAVGWLARARNVDPMSSAFLRLLHEKMFSNVWRWAGQYRLSDKNIGVPWAQIPTRVEDLVRDVAEQVASKSYPPDEIAARFHHRLVSIHLFPNGNGRHARMTSDILLRRVLDRPPFTWGSAGLGIGGAVRPAYIAALQEADRHDYTDLFAFVRS
jgi:Fic-DOC domain mobile mystery protein B